MENNPRNHTSRITMKLYQLFTKCNSGHTSTINYTKKDTKREKFVQLVIK